MELLLQNKEIVVHFDEQIIFEQLDQNENAIWSLLLASGYLKAVEVEYRGLLREKMVSPSDYKSGNHGNVYDDVSWVV